VATVLYMQDNPRLNVPRFDLPGYLFLAFGMVAVSLAVDGLSGLGLKQASVLVLLVFGMASLTAYWLHAAKRPDPLFSPKLFSIPTLSIGLLGNLFSRLGSSACPSWCRCAAGQPGLLAAAGRDDDGAGGRGQHADKTRHHAADHALRLSQGAGDQHRAGGPDDGELCLHHAGPAAVAAHPAAGLLWRGQLDAVHRDEHRHLRDLDSGMASSGNSLLSMVQMLAMSMGVAAAGAVLAAFTGLFGAGEAVQTLHSFQATFAAMGLITLASAGFSGSCRQR
jgi:hypothetical protein